MRTLSVFPAILAASLLASAPAHAFIASNGLVVNDEGGGTFNIPFRGLSGDGDFWCAAGEYVRRGLGMSGATRIFRLSEPPRRRGEGVRFSLNPEGAASRTGIASFSSGPAGSLTASSAEGTCMPTMRFRDN